LDDEGGRIERAAPFVIYNRTAKPGSLAVSSRISGEIPTWLLSESEDRPSDAGRPVFASGLA
jgi:hypothetical protein